RIEVAGEGQRVAAGAVADLLRGLLHVLGRPAAERHARALLGQHLGARAAEPLAGAAHDRHLVPELEIHQTAPSSTGGAGARSAAVRLDMSSSRMRRMGGRISGTTAIITASSQESSA